MNRDQIKSLRERIESAERKHRWGVRHEKTADPAEVIKARKIIAAFEERNEKRYSELCEKIQAAYSSAEEAIIFGDAISALAAVKAFEAMKFGRK